MYGGAIHILGAVRVSTVVLMLRACLPRWTIEYVLEGPYRTIPRGEPKELVVWPSSYHTAGLVLTIVIGTPI